MKLYRADRVLKLEVADHGIGIARNEQSKVFEKFYRAGNPLVHNTKGSGLGLSLVRHIAHAATAPGAYRAEIACLAPDELNVRSCGPHRLPDAFEGADPTCVSYK